MVYPVKIYNGNGEYVKTVVPEFDYSGKNNKRVFQAHPCPGCQDNTTNKKYCARCLTKRAEKYNV